MKYSVKSMNEWLYPDSVINEETHFAKLFAVKNGSDGFQVLLTDLPDKAVTFKLKLQNNAPLSVEVFSEISVNVECNTGPYGFTGTWRISKGFATRRAPFRVFDALLPTENGEIKKEGSTAAVYVSVKADGDLSGVFKNELLIGVGDDEFSVPFDVTVSDGVLHEDSFGFTNWISFKNTYKLHGVEPYSEEHFEILKDYIALMRRMHQNTFLTQGFILSCAFVKDDGSYGFDFSNAKRIIEMFLDAGFTTIEGEHIFTRDSWGDKDFKVTTPKGRFSALSPEAYEFVAAFFKAWREFLCENGWYDKLVQHVGDEPHERAAADYRILSGIVRKFMPGVPLLDAIETHELQGSMDIWVPKNDYYSRNMAAMERLRSLGDEIWFYTCCIPGGRYCNRLLDMPLMRTRMLFWGAYRYRLTGFLHWGLNYWNDPKRPFEITCPLNSPTNRLPAGDTHILYPLGKEIFGSMRAELSRGGTEDHELLKALAEKDKSLADSICSTVFRAFDDCDNDAQAFDSLHDKLIEACAKNRI